ncbi:MAG TPA: transcription-repair coupling factor [Syntrophomonadaceae bacterium]|nr:transcription-repair coupling factor [Syntrophomonadaceae bacterium]
MNETLFKHLAGCLARRENLLLTGLSGAAKSYVIHHLVEEHPGYVLCLVPDEEKAYDLQRGLEGLVPRERIRLFLGRDLAFMKENYSSVEVGRIITLDDCLFHRRRNLYIIATPGAFLFPILSPRQMQEQTLHLEVGQERSRDGIARSLVENGYSRADTITRPGEFAIRGGLLDIYPLNEKKPYRLDFFGDTIEFIRTFDINSQLSVEKQTKITVLPADEMARKGLQASLFDYLVGEGLVFFDEPRDFYKTWERSLKRYRETIKEAHKEGKSVPELEPQDREVWSAQLDKRQVLYHSFFPGNIPQVQVGSLEHISQQEMEYFHNNLELLFSRLSEWLSRGYEVQMAVKGKTARELISKELLDRHLSGVEFVDCAFEKGFISQTLKLALVGEKDIWRKKGTRSRKRSSQQQERLLVEDLRIGDYVVHENHGIGIFRGVTQVTSDGVTREYIILQYAGTDRLYLPLDKLDLLYRFTTSEEKEPRLSRLGGSDWERTKQRVADSIQEMAQELLLRYARRQAQEGYIYSPDTPWQGQFEEAFPYQETADQLQAIKDVKRDMESRRPMDRLVCGDVGYGKTEVAMRAAFKAVMDGKQVVILVPTTVLAEQHYQSFRERFAPYPTVIEALSRFRSPAEQRKIAAELRKGLVDVVIGTHRLLSRDVEFKDLGLLIIDEEHRFGVVQKEKIRAYKELVDVLSLSATPIPRSLYMSLTGLRDMTVIETPPPERYPISTYVLEYNEEIILEAMVSEIERNGQVFFVHNRIEDIYRVKEDLQRLLPGISIAVGHGRMNEETLARTMIDFVQGKYQVFLCTTIIESGLDMPNVNTIIVDEADKMGLAQLYQLRGRVGRSNRLAYAFLTYRPYKVINENAQKRLNAIREFTELGSGIKIALRDLEIRGAGNILGPEQHGYIQAVGFDMYCRLLEQETARLKGEAPVETLHPQLDIDSDYYIPDNYIPDSGTKMRIYRRLLLSANQEEVEEIKDELVDRFGKLPPAVENFLQISRLRVLARDKKIKTLRRKGSTIELQLAQKLPSGFDPRTLGGTIKKINDYTVILKREKHTLKDLQILLENI